MRKETHPIDLRTRLWLAVGEPPKLDGMTEAAGRAVHHVKGERCIGSGKAKC